ncbi:unnamed protein product [Macrosiphum euphorbiae]|uniref:MIF4G domain-containing protein n=1 Tax=Macrosiphum euphorbiae TaxID=13131 RepID=A0AAV0VR97_9HEMI|nr:unnamed protein product [Macrosiphum euphorbiae]
MEQKNNSDQVLNTVRSIVYHLNDVNWVKMTQKMMALPINNVKLLDDITNIIFDRALKRQNYTHIYAQMCARLINDSKFNNLIATDTEITFQKVLLKKCHDVFYSNYQEELNKLKDTMKNDNMVPKKCLSGVLNNFLFDIQKRSICNCRFIGELFKNGAFPEKYILKCIGDLGKEKNDNNYELQMHCLCIILQSVGLILSKTSYDLNKKINKLVSSMENHGMSSTLKCLIKKLKIMNSKGWMDEEPVKLIAGTNYNAYRDLPPHMQMVYRVRSKKIMSDWAYDESHDHRLNVVNNYKIEVRSNIPPKL